MCMHQESIDLKYSRVYLGCSSVLESLLDCSGLIVFVVIEEEEEEAAFALLSNAVNALAAFPIPEDAEADAENADRF